MSPKAKQPPNWISWLPTAITAAGAIVAAVLAFFGGQMSARAALTISCPDEWEKAIKFVEAHPQAGLPTISQDNPGQAQCDLNAILIKYQATPSPSPNASLSSTPTSTPSHTDAQLWTPTPHTDATIIVTPKKK